jgi:hypothetical protein
MSHATATQTWDLAQHCRKLDEQGFTVLPGLMPEATRFAAARRMEELFAEEGDRAGWEFKSEPTARRLANLVDKGEIFVELIAHPVVQELVRHVIGPEYKLGSLNGRAASPNSEAGQPLHVDMGMLPDAQGPCGCNTMWMLDAFTSENGPLRIVPGSHLSGRRPQEVLADPQSPHPDEVYVTGAAGTVAVVNTHTWHGGTANRTSGPRRALHAFYVRRDKPQQVWQKRWLSAELQSKLSPELRWLLALDDPLNDELSEAPAVTSGFMR